MSNENQPTAAMDSLLQALQVNIIPNQEYLLQGSILDTAVQRVLHRLVFFFHFISLHSFIKKTIFQPKRTLRQRRNCSRTILRL